MKVTDEAGNHADHDFILTAIAIYGLENLTGRLLQVDQEADLLEGLTVAEGLTLQKVEMIQDDVRTVIENPNSVTFEYPCSIDVILTVAKADGSEIEVCVNDLTVNPLPYNAVPITDLKPEEILPILGQIEAGDVHAYDHIEHLRLAEATRIRDMMWEYGAGSHSKEEYQELMGRLNTGLRGEIPIGYDDDNYVIMGTQQSMTPDGHAHAEFSILNELISHAQFILLMGDNDDWPKPMFDLIKEHPNSINIF